MDRSDSEIVQKALEKYKSAKLKAIEYQNMQESMMRKFTVYGVMAVSGSFVFYMLTRKIIRAGLYIGMPCCFVWSYYQYQEMEKSPKS